MGLWARIRGKDKGLRRPNQPASALGSLADVNTVSPYGLWADLPNDALLREVDPGVFVSVTETRPTDTERGDPVFFRPATNTRIIARNNGDLDISTAEADGTVNIETVSANITASSSVTIDSPQSTFTGDVQVDGALNVDGDIIGGSKDYLTHTHAQGNDSDGDTQVNTGGIA